MVHVNEELEVIGEVPLERLVVAAVQPPPELVTHAAHAHVAPVKDPTVQPAGLVAPEVSVVHVQVHVPQGDVIVVEELPVVDLCLVRRERHHRAPELVEERVLGHVLLEQHLADVRDEGDRKVDLALEHPRILTGGPIWIHAPVQRLLGVRVIGETRLQHFVVAHLPSLGEPSHLSAHLNEACVIVLLGSPEVVVDAFVVRALDLVRRERLLPLLGRLPEVVAIEICEGHPLGDDDPVRGLVADVPKVEGGRLHGEDRLD
mmetsp:Transcript_27249/g.74949  ORF Transcript_27249/g.74949 Transcript_27249/m.74949 type:complete len:260 (-) Transcript_27249:769-1548(-)